jgi:hypothetical protein
MAIMRLIVGVLIAVGIAAMLILGLVAFEDDEPTQEEANEQFCEDVGEFIAALGELRDVDEDTEIEDFEETREIVVERYEAMIQSAANLREAKIEDVEEANEELRAAIDDISDEQSFEEALDSIEDEADELATQVSQLLAETESCGSGQGAQERSDE